MSNMAFGYGLYSNKKKGGYETKRITPIIGGSSINEVDEILSERPKEPSIGNVISSLPQSKAHQLRQQQIADLNKQGGFWGSLGAGLAGVADVALTPIENFFNQNQAGQFAQRAADVTGNLMTFGASSALKGTEDQPYQPISTGSKGLDVTADVIGNIAGLVQPYRAAEGATQALGQGLSKLLPQTSKAPQIAKTFARGATTGALGEGAIELADMEQNIRGTEEETAQERFANIALGAGLGGLADVGLSKIMSGLSKVKKPQEEQLMLSAPQEQSALPTPQEQLMLPGYRQIEETTMKPKGVSFVRPSTPMKVTGADESQLKELYKLAEQRGLPTGREYEALQGLWSEVAPKTGGTLEELVEQTYKKKPSLEELIPQIKGKQSEMERYGINPLEDLQRRLSPVTRTIDEPVGFTDETLPTTRLDEQLQGGLPKSSDQQYQQIIEESTGIAPAKTQVEKIEPIPLKTEPLDGLIPATTKKLQKKLAKEPELQKDVADSAYELGKWDTATSDLWRNAKKIFGDNYGTFKGKYLDPFVSSKNDYVDMQRKYADELKTEIVDKFKISKGSKDSALVQQYGEGQITIQELKEKSPSKWKDIVKAEQWFRQKYDGLLDQVNSARSQVYPGDETKIIPKRKDYFRHFQEEGGLMSMLNLMESVGKGAQDIPDHIRPKMIKRGFMKQRGEGEFKNDAIGGFLNYLPAAAKAIHIDKHASVFRNIGKELGESGKDEAKRFFSRFADDLQGIPIGSTKLFRESVPEPIQKGILFLNNRVKSNAILGNISSALSQTGSVPAGVAVAGVGNSIKGAAGALRSIVDKTAPVYNSPFMKERYSGGIYRQFNDKLIEQPRKLAEVILETAERTGGTFVWSSLYEKALSEGVKNPIRYADDEARRVLAGRGIGEVPLGQKQIMAQTLLPFTYEVANAWKVIGDMWKGDKSQLLTLFVGSYLLNEAIEGATGRRVVFDPIEAGFDAYEEAEKEDTTLSGAGAAVGRMSGEVLGQIPGAGQFISTFMPDKIKREKIFGSADPGRFGGTPALLTPLADLARGNVGKAVSKVVLPFGGRQVEKTIEGAKALKEGGVFTKEGELQFLTEKKPTDALKNLLFGKFSTDEAREYFEKNRRNLSGEDTESVMSSRNPKETYEKIMKRKEIDKIQRLINSTKKNTDLQKEERDGKIKKLTEQIREINKRGVGANAQ